MEKLKRNRIWSIIGKITALLTLLWITIQLYNYFTFNNEYKIYAYGKYSEFIIPNDYLKLLDDYKTLIALDKAYVENLDSKGAGIKGLNEYLKSEDKKDYFDISFNSYLINDRHINITEYSSVFNYFIENNGNKPIEDLVLEIPFSGYFHINRKKGSFSEGNFSKHIEIGTLLPGYSININLWSKSLFLFSEYEEGKTRITHKYGCEKIKYPIEVQGLLAWNIRNHNFPLIIVSIFILLSIYIAFLLGVDYGPSIKKKEKERKIREVEELEQLKKEVDNVKDKEEINTEHDLDSKDISKENIENN